MAVADNVDAPLRLQRSEMEIEPWQSQRQRSVVSVNAMNLKHQTQKLILIKWCKEDNKGDVCGIEQFSRIFWTQGQLHTRVECATLREPMSVLSCGLICMIITTQIVLVLIVRL